NLVVHDYCHHRHLATSTTIDDMKNELDTSGFITLHGKCHTASYKFLSAVYSSVFKMMHKMKIEHIDAIYLLSAEPKAHK
ncbi:hypothetical protein L9F63_016060, partial [Diploptera punctata]